MEKSWNDLLSNLASISVDGFSVLDLVVPISDPIYDAATTSELLEVVPVTSDDQADVMFVADDVALTGTDHSLLAVCLYGQLRTVDTFRCPAMHLLTVDSNINDHNLDWSDFTTHLDSTGTFRGFRRPGRRHNDTG